MDYKERGFHERGVYPTQDTSRMKTERVKEEEEADTKIIVRVVWNTEGRNVGTIKGKCTKQGLTIELSQRRESSYHWLD